MQLCKLASEVAVEVHLNYFWNTIVLSQQTFPDAIKQSGIGKS
jgi:hypothetical protein